MKKMGYPCPHDSGTYTAHTRPCFFAGDILYYMESLPGNFFAFLLPLKGLAEIAERRKTDLGKSLSLGGGGGGGA